MKKIIITGLFLIGIIFLWTSCQKETKARFTEIEMSGQVLNAQGSSLSGVLLELGNEKVYSDGSGNFTIKTSYLDPEEPLLLKVALSGYMSRSYNFSVKNWAKHKRIVILNEADERDSFTFANGGTVNLPSGAAVTIPASGVTLMDGSAYTGTMVNVAVQEINEDDGIIFSAMIPSNTLTAEDVSGNRQELYSYGMLNVELSGDNGEALQLGTGQVSTLTFSIPTNQLNSAPNTIPLWYFDEVAGLWKEEGTATKQGTNYVGMVYHFTTWNCDQPHPPCTISGCIEDEAGNGLENLNLQVGQLYVVTDADGCFSVSVPSQLLPIRVIHLDYNQMVSCVLYSLSNVITPNATYNTGSLPYLTNCGGLQSSWQVYVPSVIILELDSTEVISVMVTDSNQQGIVGVEVGYNIMTGDGSLNSNQENTDGGGIATVEWTFGSSVPQSLNVVVGSQTYVVEARQIVMGTMVDSRDGTVYETVTYPNGQKWMAENLRYDIPSVLDPFDAINPNRPNMKDGRLYDWNTVMGGANTSNTIPSGIQGICPNGWHLPSDLEWMELEKNLGMNLIDIKNLGDRGSYQGMKMKSVNGWNNQGNGTDSYGFNALPAGTSHPNAGLGMYSGLGDLAQFWSSTKSQSGFFVYSRSLSKGSVKLKREYYIKNRGCSCRCLEN
jgi:uncharacterized protein (TIGR02145 family)